MSGASKWRFGPARLCLSGALVCLITMPAALRLEAQTPQQSVIDLPNDVDRVLRDYESAWAARDAEALANLFTPDGFVLRPGSPLVLGPDAILDGVPGLWRPAGPEAVWLRDSDSVGYIVGGFAGRAAGADMGKFVLTLRRAASGRWLIAADMDNRNSR